MIGFGSPTVRYIGIAVVAGVITWILWPDNDDNMSPACPNKTCK